MSKRVNIAAFGLNEHLLRGKTQEEIIPFILEKIDSVRGCHPDLIALPELFLKIGGDKENPNWRENAVLMTEKMRDCAREMNCYIVNSVYEPYREDRHLRCNVAMLIDRDGEIVGKYRKMHTVQYETKEDGVIPGSEVPVFDTDFGRIALQTCFDIGWRDTWRELAGRGVQMVVWNSAYDGGSLLNAYAAVNMYYVVSAVRSSHARIIDITGHTVAQGSRWDGLAMATVDMDTTLFHIDMNWTKIGQIRRDLGDKVTITSYSEENVFLLQPNDPEYPVSRICEMYGLVTYRDYHLDAERVQAEWRRKYPCP